MGCLRLFRRQRKASKQQRRMINAAIILPTIAPTAVPPSLDEPGAGVGPAEVELEVTKDSVEEPDSDGGGDVMVDAVGDKVEGDVAGVEVRVGVVLVELDGVGDTGDVGPP